MHFIIKFVDSRIKFLSTSDELLKTPSY